jgi:hypothetical protein
MSGTFQHADSCYHKILEQRLCLWGLKFSILVLEHNELYWSPPANTHSSPHPGSFRLQWSILAPISFLPQFLHGSLLPANSHRFLPSFRAATQSWREPPHHLRCPHVHTQFLCWSWSCLLQLCVTESSRGGHTKDSSSAHQPLSNTVLSWVTSIPLAHCKPCALPSTPCGGMQLSWACPFQSLPRRASPLPLRILLHRLQMAAVLSKGVQVLSGALRVHVGQNFFAAHLNYSV